LEDEAAFFPAADAVPLEGLFAGTELVFFDGVFFGSLDAADVCAAGALAPRAIGTPAVSKEPSRTAI